MIGDVQKSIIHFNGLTDHPKIPDKPIYFFFFEKLINRLIADYLQIID